MYYNLFKYNVKKYISILVLFIECQSRRRNGRTTSIVQCAAENLALHQEALSVLDVGTPFAGIVLNICIENSALLIRLIIFFNLLQNLFHIIIFITI